MLAARSDRRRSLQRRVLTSSERKSDPSELKQAKRRVGMLRRWLERLPDGDLEATPVNKRRARWALLLVSAEPGFKLEPGVAGRLTALVDKPARTQAEKPSPEVREEAAQDEYDSAYFKSAKAEQKAKALVSEFGFKAITTAKDEWTLAELTALAAALHLVPDRDTPALKGAIVVKEPAPADGEDRDFRGEWDTSGGYGGVPRMRLMQSVFDDEVVAAVVLHEVGHAISLPLPGRIARFERLVRETRHQPRLVDHSFIRTFVDRMWADHVIKHLKANDFNEYLAEAYAIWLTHRSSLPAPLVRFFDELR